MILDNAAAMAGLVEHLAERGYCRIGGLFGSTSTTAAERRDGYIAAMRRHGLEPDYREVEPTAEAAIATVEQWLTGPSRPDALVASNSLLLMGALKAARSAGLAIPGELALAGFDNERWTELVEPGVTVVEQPVEEDGAGRDVAAAGAPAHAGAAGTQTGDDGKMRGERVNGCAMVRRCACGSSSRSRSP